MLREQNRALSEEQESQKAAAKAAKEAAAEALRVSKADLAQEKRERGVQSDALKVVSHELADAQSNYAFQAGLLESSQQLLDRTTEGMAAVQSAGQPVQGATKSLEAQRGRHQST